MRTATGHERWAWGEESTGLENPEGKTNVQGGVSHSGTRLYSVPSYLLIITEVGYE